MSAPPAWRGRLVVSENQNQSYTRPHAILYLDPVACRTFRAVEVGVGTGSQDALRSLRVFQRCAGGCFFPNAQEGRWLASESTR
jgi:hypothetical protein